MNQPPSHAMGDPDDAFKKEREVLNSQLDDFEVLDLIDRGGQGVVYKAVQKSTGRVVALKLLQEGPVLSLRQRARFAREVKIAARIHHPNVVTLFGSGIVAGRPYFAMEFIDGLTIADYFLVNRPTVAGCVSIFEKICRAIATVHQRGIIHRDLKPGNILVDLDGEPHVVDFGLAKSLFEEEDDLTLTASDRVLGTLPFLSPEQARGDDDIDTRSDIYALGLILYFLLTRSMPYPVDGDQHQVRENIVHKMPRPLDRWRTHSSTDAGALGEISSDLSHIVSKALSKERERRYQSADAFADDLARYRTGDVVEAKADSRFYLLRRTLHRYRVHATVAAAFVILLAGSLVGMAVLLRRAERIADTATAGLKAGSFVRVGSVLRDEGRIDQAIAMFESAIEIGGRADDSDNVIHRFVFTAYHELGDIYSRMPNKLDKCRKYCDAASRLAENLLAQEPHSSEYLRLVAFSRRLRGRLAFAEEDWPKAHDLYSQAVELFESVRRADGNAVQSRFEKAMSLQWLCRTLVKQERRADAIRGYEQVRQALVEVCEAAPDNFDYEIELARTESRMAECLLKNRTLADDQQASKWLASAQSRMDSAIESGVAASRDPEVRKFLGDLKQNQELVERRAERRRTASR